jgi:hypothetical protein
MSDRLIKQVTIAAIILVLGGGISYSIYSFVSLDPTCYDGVKNQGEEGIDCGVKCGTVCEPTIVPLEVISQKLIKAGEGEYDFVAQVRNPNTLHGATNVSYEINLKTKDGSPLDVIRGTFYILPVQTKYLVKTPIRRAEEGITSEFVLKDATWHTVSVADLGIDFPLIGEQHGAVSLPGVKYQVEGTLSNTSDFNFDQVDVLVFLQDEQGEIQAITTTTINTFLSDTLRYFKVVWPEEVSGSGLVPQVQAGTNVFNNSNFIRRYGTQEKFQRF